MCHHPQFLLVGLHSFVCKRKLNNFNQYNLKDLHTSAFLWAHCFVPLFRKATFCGVPSRAVQIVCAAGKEKKVSEHCDREPSLLRKYSYCRHSN
jgi:hypothetical protein